MLWKTVLKPYVMLQTINYYKIRGDPKCMIREELEACALLPWANPVTNESLRAIMAGVAPNKRDTILAVGLDPVSRPH